MATYKSPYESKITQLAQQVASRQPFTYDPTTDAAYQAAAKQYNIQGNKARENTLGSYAQNTGGYASSYAVSAAQQAQNDYNIQLSNLIPQLMQNAYARYQAEGDALQDQLAMYQGLDNTAYNRWMDELAMNQAASGGSGGRSGSGGGRSSSSGSTSSGAFVSGAKAKANNFGSTISKLNGISSNPIAKNNILGKSSALLSSYDKSKYYTQGKR